MSKDKGAVKEKLGEVIDAVKEASMSSINPKKGKYGDKTIKKYLDKFEKAFSGNIFSLDQRKTVAELKRALNNMDEITIELDELMNDIEWYFKDDFFAVPGEDVDKLRQKTMNKLSKLQSFIDIISDLPEDLSRLTIDMEYVLRDVNKMKRLAADIRKLDMKKIIPTY